MFGGSGPLESEAEVFTAKTTWVNNGDGAERSRTMQARLSRQPPSELPSNQQQQRETQRRKAVPRQSHRRCRCGPCQCGASRCSTTSCGFVRVWAKSINKNAVCTRTHCEINDQKPVSEVLQGQLNCTGNCSRHYPFGVLEPRRNLTTFFGSSLRIVYIEFLFSARIFSAPVRQRRTRRWTSLQASL